MGSLDIGKKRKAFKRLGRFQSLVGRKETVMQQVAAETFVDSKLGSSLWEEIMIPGISAITLKGLRGKFPRMGILEAVDESVLVPVRIVPKGLSTCTAGAVDGARYGAKIETEKGRQGRWAGVAGYQHARWLIEKRPLALLELLRNGFCLEFPGTVITVPKVVKDRVVGQQKLIPFMPRIHNGSGLHMTWGLLGAGDLDTRTRVAFAVPPVGK